MVLDGLGELSYRTELWVVLHMEYMYVCAPRLDTHYESSGADKDVFACNQLSLHLPSLKL